MKKLLAETEQKMLNRIKLFKKSSDKMIKKRESEFKIFPKPEYTKSHPVIEWVKTREEIRTAEGKRKRQERSQKF